MTQPSLPPRPKPRRCPSAAKAAPLRLAALLWRRRSPARRRAARAGVPLFNGKDLSGWHNINCAPSTWSVKDGAIYSTGAPICELRTERMYENFVLDVEWMHLTPKGNAGVFIWADPLPARGQPFLRAIEVQVLDGRETPNYTSHGDIFPIHGAKMTPDRPHPGGWDRSLPTEKRAKPAGQWNHYRITADRGRITLEVNGKAVSGGHDITPRKGYIALESEGAPAMFRNLRIRELPSAGALPADQVAAADEGYRSLYTGVGSVRLDARTARRDTSRRPTGRSRPAVRAARPRARSCRPRRFEDLDFFIDWRCGAPEENEKPAPKEVTVDARRRRDRRRATGTSGCDCRAAIASRVRPTGSGGIARASPSVTDRSGRRTQRTRAPGGLAIDATPCPRPHLNHARRRRDDARQPVRARSAIEPLRR